MVSRGDEAGSTEYQQMTDGMTKGLRTPNLGLPGGRVSELNGGRGLRSNSRDRQRDVD